MTASAKAAASPDRPVPLVILGAGAAGLFAAASAAAEGLPALLVERKARPGAKLLMTANGRCNYTKALPPERFAADLGEPAATFALPALRACPPALVERFFRNLGVPSRRMRDGRVFPASGQAASVVHAFGDFLRDSTFPVLYNAPVRAISRRPSGGFSVALDAFSIPAARVLLATGGASFPKTGSVGDGYAFARALGHTVTPLRPGLVGFAVPATNLPPGERFENARVRVLSPSSPRPGGPGSVRAASLELDQNAPVACPAPDREKARPSPNNNVLFEATGEVEIESWGLSGAAVYNASRYLAHHPCRDFTLEIQLDSSPPLRFRNPVPRPLKEAIVSVGGVAIGEVDPLTMQSRLVPGLYFAGEVLDLDGPHGGYNLTLAFATARLAVTSIPR